MGGNRPPIANASSDQTVIVNAIIAALSNPVPAAAAVSKQDASEDLAASELPTEFQLAQNYPNPFNPSTTISFALPQASEVSLSIYDMSGQLVKQLIASEMAAGHHSVRWDATDDHGVRVASGMYLCLIKAGTSAAQRKLVLMK